LWSNQTHRQSRHADPPPGVTWEIPSPSCTGKIVFPKCGVSRLRQREGVTAHAAGTGYEIGHATHRSGTVEHWVRALIVVKVAGPDELDLLRLEQWIDRLNPELVGGAAVQPGR
jgi:hypothetical protein